ncbi:MAG: hypothetical protein ACJ8ER_03495 [Allosphingosinicella sp.]
MPRPFTAAQQAENDHFLEVLGQTGNARLSARSVGRRLSTMFHRRGAHSAFAQEWEAKAAAAHARFHLAGGKRGPEPERANAGKRDSRFRGNDGAALRTKGGEAMVVRTRTGRLQIRLAHPGKLTHAAEQTFLRALAATANVRLSAAAAGASVAAFYRRRRQNPVFAREMRLALRMGFERIEAAALDAALPEAHRHDAWRRGEPAPIPPLSWDQAFQLLCFHEKSVRQGWEQPHRRRRRGESDAVYIERLRAMWGAEKDLEAEEDALRRAARFDETGDWRFEDEAPPPPLPPLELVTGWSKAKGGPAHNPDLALFGGWRIGEMRRKLAKG